MNFNDFKGSKAVVDDLKNLSLSRRLPHAVLIDGGSKDERLDLAKILAKAFVCEGETPPCGDCSNCKKAESGNHGDIIMISGGEALGSFKIDSIRNEVRNTAYIMPNEARCKVYILQNTQSMMAPAQNALLKILEEPPEFVAFILTCDSKTKMLETIRSRVTAFTLDSDINSGKTEKASKIVAELAGALIKPDEFSFLSMAGAMEKDKELLSAVITELNLLFRDAVVLCGGGESILSGHREAAELLAENLTPERLLSCHNIMDDFESSIQFYPNQNLLLTRLCSKLREAIGR